MSESNAPASKFSVVLNVSKKIVRCLLHDFLLPVLSDLYRVLLAIVRALFSLFTKRAVVGVKTLHQKQHWLQRSGSTLRGNAIGLCIAMISAQIISHFVEVRGAGNLWGLFSSKTTISDNTYRVVSFVVEFLVTLIVFSWVESHLDQQQTAGSETDDE